MFLGPSDFFTAEQALEEALIEHRYEKPLKDVLIVGCHDDGSMYIGSSHVSREWALWMAHELIDYIRRVGRHEPNES